MTHEARENVLRAAGGDGDDEVNWSRRIGLRPGDARYRWEHGSTRCQLQKSTARKFHGVILWTFAMNGRIQKVRTDAAIPDNAVF